MKKILVSILLTLSVLPSFAQNTSENDSLLTASSVFVGENIRQMLDMCKKNFEGMGIAFDENKCLDSALEYIKGKQMPFSNDQALKILNSASEKAYKKQIAENKAKGEAFLAENAKQKDVQKTASGLQYKVLKKGKGAQPSKEDKVKVHYEGRTIDGKVFDSSIKRGEPTEFGVTQVIKGWTEALQLMPVGSKWELYIPSDLAYGERGAGADIKPNETLIFTVELLDIIKKDSSNGNESKKPAPAKQPAKTKK